MDYDDAALAEHDRAECEAHDRADSDAKRIEKARKTLVAEIAAAFDAGGETKVSTPGFGRSVEKLTYIVGDHFAGQDGDADFNEAIAIIALASKTPGLLGLRASGLIAKIANKHAEFHAADLADSEVH